MFCACWALLPVMRSSQQAFCIVVFSMGKTVSNLHFRLMALSLRLRDLFLPRRLILAEVQIRPGSTVLDFGCGPGSYSVVAADIVGPDGKVYALDIHPLAGRMVQKAAAKKSLNNIETICSDCATGLKDATVDVALLCDTFHMLDNRHAVLQELHRVLKPEAILLFNDHHMKENDILYDVTAGGLFRLSGKGRRTYAFMKQKTKRFIEA